MSWKVGVVVGVFGLLCIVLGVGGGYMSRHYDLISPRKPEPALAPGKQIVQPFGPVPHIIVTQAPSPVPTPSPPVVEPAPAVIEKQVVKPKAPVKKRKKASDVKKLKSKWAAPQERPFSLGDLFNVK